ncbi:MAG: hypothetical protein HY699_14830 [Deltaproteobacteria bacterium]|nr:hypothetical protein [Deltaproteobacteria bacterium]
MSADYHRATRRRRRRAGSGLLLTVLSSLLAMPAAAQIITAGEACGQPGTSVWFDVTLDPQGKSIAATQNDISFNSTNTPIATCVREAQLSKELSLAFLPAGCSGTACTALRAIMLSTSDSGAIGQPTVLYRCRVDIPANATPGSYPLVIHNAAGADPVTNPKPITGLDGQLGVTPGNCGC